MMHGQKHIQLKSH